MCVGIYHVHLLWLLFHSLLAILTVCRAITWSLVLLLRPSLLPILAVCTAAAAGAVSLVLVLRLRL